MSRAPASPVTGIPGPRERTGDKGGQGTSIPRALGADRGSGWARHRELSTVPFPLAAVARNHAAPGAGPRGPKDEAGAREAKGRGHGTATRVSEEGGRGGGAGGPAEGGPIREGV